MRRQCRRNMPANIKIATTWYKPEKNMTAIAPDFYVHETNGWLVFPHELDGLPREELREHKPFVEDILVKVDEHRAG